MLLAVGCSLGVVIVLRSPVAPAISAGVLPVVLAVDSWMYPFAILVGTSILALLSVQWRAWSRLGVPIERVEATDSNRNLPLLGYKLAFKLLLLIVILLVAVNVAGQRMILFPPLVVIAFEMFTYTSRCPWAKTPWRLPIVCTATALIGVLAVEVLGVGNPPKRCGANFGQPHNGVDDKEWHGWYESEREQVERAFAFKHFVDATKSLLHSVLNPIPQQVSTDQKGNHCPARGTNADDQQAFPKTEIPSAD